MKYNIFRYIFFIFVAILLLVSIFLIYKDNKNSNTKIISNTKEISIKKEINIGIAEFDTINPILTKNYDVQYIDKLIFRSLLNISKDMKMQNDLAEECSKISNKVYIIKLKQNINWHNEEMVTANDVKFTIKNIKQTESIYKENVKHIEKIEIIDDYTLKIYLNSEVPFFEYMLTFPILNKNQYNSNTLESNNNIPIGTGEYKIKKISEKEIKIQNKDNKINIKIYKEIKDLYLAFSKEEIDLIDTKNINYEEYTGIIGLNNQLSTEREFDYLALNNNNKLLQNANIRKAISYFIDKKKIIYTIFNNKYSISNFPINNESYLYNEEIYDRFNLDEGKRILTSNKCKLQNGIWQKDGVKFEFNLVVNLNNKKRCEVANEIKEQLEQAGIIINIIEANDYNYVQKIKYKNFDMLLTGTILSISPKINTFFDQDNICDYKNEEILNTLNEINNMNNENTVKDSYFRIQEIYNKEIPFVSLYINNNYIVYNSKVKGDFSHNWFNLYYNINNWYVTE